MKAILLSIIVMIGSLAGVSVESISYNTLENSQITSIDGEFVEGYEVHESYEDYDYSIDIFTEEDSGFVIFYTKDFKDIQIIDNR